MSIKLYYLASPYSSENLALVEQRYLKQQELAHHLINRGYHLITPIEMCHQLSKTYGLPIGYEYWKERDRLLIDRCDGLIVCKMEGWDVSVGVTDEIEYAQATGKPVYFLDPVTLSIDPVPCAFCNCQCNTN